MKIKRIKYQRIFLVFFFVFNISVLLAQTEEKHLIVFNLIFGNSELKIDSTYHLKNGDSIQIEALKFYISEIEFLQKDKVVWKEKSSYHLIDASNSKSLRVPLNLPTDIIFNQIKFNLGIDSITNVSGAMGGDLDPTKGMYWTWQSGYINFKLEGKSNLCKTRNNEFQFHLGGYQSPFNGLQTIVLNVAENHKTEIVLNVQKSMDLINLSKQDHIMSPSKDAILLAEYITKLFSIK